MAEVFRARRVGAGGFSKQVCIKRIHSHLSEDGTVVAMFLDEGRTGSKLRHRNIVAIDDMGQHEGQLFLAMEFVHGVDLARVEERLASVGRKVPTSVALFVVSEILQALSYAHEARDPDTGKPLKVVHRDIAPHNVLVSYAGEVKLGDFGIARAEGRSHVTQGEVVRGRFGYMPVEQYSGGAIDRRADLYALGVVLYEMLSGCSPFDVPESQHSMHAIVAAQVTDATIALSARVPSLSEPVYALVESLLAKHADDRFASADAALAVLERAPERVGGALALAALMGELFPSHASVAATARPVLPEIFQGPTRTSLKPATSPGLQDSEPIASAPALAPPPSARADRRDSTLRWPVILLAISLFVASSVGVVALVRSRQAPALTDPLRETMRDASVLSAPQLVDAASVSPDTRALSVDAFVPLAVRVGPRVVPPLRSPQDASVALSVPMVRVAERGTIRVVVTPFGQISIDGAPLSSEFSGARDFAVSAGRHRVRVTGPFEQERVVEVAGGEVETVRFQD